MGPALPLYLLNLPGTDTPAPGPGTATAGTYGPYLIYGLNLTATSPTTTPAAADLLLAILQAFQRSAIAPLVSDQIYLKIAGRRAAMPYIIVDESGATLKLKTSTSTIRDTRIRFRVYADDGTTAGVIGDALEAFFTGQRLSFEAGWATEFVPGDRKELRDPTLSRQGNEVWYQSLEFTTRVKR